MLLQHAAIHCITATHCSILQHTTTLLSNGTATCCNTLRHCNTLQHTTTLLSNGTATRCITATHCNTLQHYTAMALQHAAIRCIIATHCNTLQHTTALLSNGTTTCCNMLHHTAPTSQQVSTALSRSLVLFRPRSLHPYTHIYIYIYICKHISYMFVPKVSDSHTYTQIHTQEHIYSCLKFPQLSSFRLTYIYTDTYTRTIYSCLKFQKLSFSL